MLRFTTTCALLALLSSRAIPAPPAQFYTNSDGAYAWSADNKKNARTTILFAKNPTDASSYRQLTAVIYDGRPDEVIYLDVAEKRVVGRLDLKAEKFSLLPPAAQKVRQPIEKFDFPPPTALPRVEQLFQPLPDGSATNRDRLALPPPTLQHPRLENSTWDTCYLSADKFLIRSTLKLNGDSGTYELTEKPGTGRLSDVNYEREGDEHVIRGNWALGRSLGWFKFNIPAHNLNVFWGEFGFDQGRTMGAWSGIRRPPSALKIEEKTVR